ncbi:MAG TPA: hypothetical protein VLA74_07515 [Nitrososphaeraceae archaeon]|nr:hypothetical protein [Nitrososphaeraceae archaeon]
MIIKQKLAITMIILFSLAMIMTPTVYAAIEKVETYAEDICINTIKVIGMAKIAIFKK